MAAQLVNDLIIVISVHTPWTTTLRLLSEFGLIRELYNPDGLLWHAKVMADNRGLIHDETRIGELRDLGWRFYYRLRSKKYFDDLYRARIYDPVLQLAVRLVTTLSVNDVTDYQSPTEPTDFPIYTTHRYIIATSNGGIHWNESSPETSQQATFGTIRIDGRGIVSVVGGSGTPGESFYFLRDNGKIYHFNRGQLETVAIDGLDSSIVSFSSGVQWRTRDRFFLVLTRAGTAYYMNGPQLLPIPGRFIELAYGTDGYIRLLRPDGSVNIPSSNPGAILSDSRGVGRIFDTTALTIRGEIPKPYDIRPVRGSVLLGVSEPLFFGGIGSRYLTYFLTPDGRVTALTSPESRTSVYEEAWKLFDRRVIYIHVRGSTGRFHSELNEVFAIAD